MLQRKKRWLVGGSIVFAVIIGLSLMTMSQNSVYFYTPGEALQKSKSLSQSTIRVGGMVEAASVQWQPEALDLKFVLTDMKGVRIHVHHRGTPPDMFKENSGVVVEGRINQEGTQVVSHQLLVKHSEEYKIPEHKPGSKNLSLIKESILKNDGSL